jgi:hypothetical protein
MPALALAPAAARARERDRLPLEFIGRARALWKLVDSEGKIVRPRQDALIARLEALAPPRPGFRRPPRRPTLRAVRAVWRALPGFGRLGLKIDLDGDDRLSIFEFRAVSTRMRMEAWGSEAADELAVGLLMIEVTFDPKRDLSIRRMPLGDCCHHAIARRYERGLDRRDEAVLRDVFSLAQHFGRGLAADGGCDFEIPAAGGGLWVGELVKYQDRPFLAARTYVAAEGSL